MKILVATLLLVATCVPSQGQPGMPAGCPTVTEKTCTTDQQCRDDVAGMMGRCNVEKQLCCDVSADGGLEDPTKCRPTDTDCKSNEDCKASFDKAECRAGKCCAYEMESEALHSPCPGLESDDVWRYGECSSLTSCSETTTCGTDEACCLAGSCGKACLPDLSQCIDPDKIFYSVIANPTCLGLFQELVTEGATFTTFCGSLIGGLSCVSEVVMSGPYHAVCKERMLKYIKADAVNLFKTIRTMLQQFGVPFAVNEEYVKMTPTCTGLKDIGDEKDDEDGKTSETGAAWNTSCPKLDHVDGLCPNDCNAKADCSGENDVCCSMGSDQCHICIPDLRPCADIERILGSQAATTCVPKLGTVLRQDDRDDFCGGIWDMFTCSAETIVGTEYTKACVERIAMILKQAPQRFIHKIQTLTANNQQLTNLRKFARDLVTECKESPLYEQPSRPVPDDVKVCSNLETILKNSAQCNRIPATSLTNAACDQLKTFVTCLANRLVAGEDEHEKRKCVGELYKVIEENNQRLNFLRGFNSRSCEERENVCGDDLKPLDNVNCTTKACPRNYECTNSYCCPQKKEGWCPKQERGSPGICKEKCKMDSDCEDDEKCCMSVACGYKTCTQKETQKVNKSQCDIEYENGRKQLERSGICREATSITKLPNCQNTRFSPMQIDIWTGKGYCVTEEGKKIRGSDFMGNRDCTKVREGKCPPVPQICRSGGRVENICQSNDMKCKDGQKCCLAETGGLCVRMCVKAEEAPENVPDECSDRKCCPVTLCQDKKCPADITAVCRINSCGGCKAEFYNLTGKVNCFEGVTVCRKGRAEAQEENARRRKTDTDRILSFLNSRDRTEREKERNTENKTMSDDEMKREDMFTDEYGEMRNGEDSLPDNTEREYDEDEENEEYASVKEYVNYRVCELFQKLNICKNGGQCKVGSGESFFEFCQCQAQYYGLICEHTGSVLPQDTQCYRDMFRLKSFHNILMSRDNPTERMVIQHALNKLKFPQMVMPKYSCDEVTGNYKQIQMGVLVNTDDKLEILYCVNTSTGVRLKGTPVTLAMSKLQPNCDLTSIMPDPLRLPRRCLAPKMAECAVTDSCQYFWNQTSATCEKGEAGHGFDTVTDCYNQCGMQRECVQEETETEADSEKEKCEMQIVSGPKPCRMTYNNVETDGCDYTKQFCSVEEDTTGQIGTCKDYPQYCMDPPHRGYGDKRIGAYFFNIMTGKCEKFVYAGNGGNKNRFYSLHQCKTECSTRPYKFDDIVCPVPRKLAMSRIDKMPVDKCDDDYSCHENQVCCSDDQVRVCTDPVQTCLSVRCSFNGACEQGRCVCSDCSTVAIAEVCGSDGKTYASECHLKRESCQTMRNITVISTGPCSKCGETYCKSYEECENNACVIRCPEFCTAQYAPVCGKGVVSGEYRSFGNDCDRKMQACTLMEKFIQVKNECCSSQDASQSCMLPYCTREYNPVCAYDTTEAAPQLHTYSNPCTFKYDKMKGRKVEVLYPGVCSTECGSTHCEMRQTCINNTCSCGNACTKKINKPICAHPTGDVSKLRTFSNLCTMRRETCLNSQTYVIFSHGPCKEPEPVHECPTNVREREGSAVITCNIENNAGCDTDMGEMCCPYGAGQTCLPKTSLVRHQETKSGICPELFGLNYDQSMCDMDTCTSDGDCSGDAKCCNNDVCGHMTCVEPSVKNDRAVCGTSARMVSKCNPDMKETGCPSGATCKSTVDGDVEIGVCCMPNDRQDTKTDLVNSKLCQLLEISGHTCQNGGTCVADLRNKTVCQCMDGYYGHFCTERNPPANPDTPCLVMKKVMMTLNKTGLISEQLSLEDFLRSRDEGEDGEEDDEEDAIEYNEPMKEWINPFLESVLHLIKSMGMTGIPQNFSNLCTSDGHFRKERCLWDPTSSLHHCLCVDPNTGSPIPHGPRVMATEDLMCDELTENMTRQDFCLLERPSMDVCGDSTTERFYFNQETMDCEVFTDYGCNENVKNNFVSYETCNSTCGAKRNQMSVCSRESCEDGKICRVKDGKKECLDPDSVDNIFEPVCDADGKFRPKQCHGEVCVCVNPETGETIADSEADAQNLQCLQEGGTVTPVRREAKKCKGNETAKFCPNGGDVCDNCKSREQNGNGRGSDRIVNDDNVCINCESCSADQGNSNCKVPQQYCQNRCQQFPDAECSFNTCTCKEEYRANDRVVNCAAVQSQCQIEQHKAKQEERANVLKNRGKQPENSKQIMCSTTGAYEAECRGNVCHCLNATDGTKIGNSQFTPDNINCASTQRKTKAERLDMKLVFPTKEKWSEMNSSKKQKITTKVHAKFEKKNMKVLKTQVFDGSIIMELNVELCTTCGGDAETTDLASLGNSVVNEVNSGEFLLEVDGETLVASTASITDVVTAEELYGPVTEVPEKEDDNKTTIIIVVVVVIVVVILAVGIACYCYQKANKSKDKDIPFSDIQGQHNPAYNKA